MDGRTFKLPTEVAELIKARNGLRERYSAYNLKFTLDGNLVGDLGEAIAAELFDLDLVGVGSHTAIDGRTRDGKKTVQVKATATGRGPAFRNTEARADHLLFFSLDLERQVGTVVFNGPERIARGLISNQAFTNQRGPSLPKIEAADREVNDCDRLPMIKK